MRAIMICLSPVRLGVAHHAIKIVHRKQVQRRQPGVSIRFRDTACTSGKQAALYASDSLCFGF
jgi:ribosomal protein L14